MLNDNEYIAIMSDNLAMLRAKAALTQAEIADVIGIPRTTYSAIENKKRKITFPVFVSLSKYFLSNKETIEIMKLLGLSEDALGQFFYIEKLIDKIPKNVETKKVAAFGGKRNSDNNEKNLKIEKAIKGIEK
ncbi:XRE family transcriptional regulator [Firmicutes bacterium AM55-24TS]|jgi:DNA-binding XRE family transcriptional regulator|nr:XRE family transcriptional regulator [Firmicutes bacterium AM55-24TS]